ncbi:hypothetical protein HYH03_011515 [Edaphochlamys debaryana]|uniref:Homologous-pairing protein 2 homolog n=1 Tax=Edaphochlamys debaryana TaxID=47281 RepID=A0A835XUL7_9CHLO|nr:hypothetical protein HYH03_011515 [Edaphochlamys debaryana]|eukprot:KAG2490050.1 hypothetical protein HYH03_011515 [Edaphochlamys debaryana]
MAAQSAEAEIERIIVDQNKPFGLQQLVDLGQTKGLKKAQVSKAVDALVLAGKIVAKEFGKTKIFLPPQGGLSVLSKEDTDSLKAKTKELHEQYQQEAVAVKRLEAELAQLRNALSQEEIDRQTAELTKKLAHDEAKLEQLQAGAVLITPEERAEVEKRLRMCLDAWRKRRGMFKNIWSAISEGLDGKQKDLYDEIGIDTDEAAGVDFGEVERLLPAVKRGRR